MASPKRLLKKKIIVYKIAVKSAIRIKKRFVRRKKK